jgi:hypothetical protein
VAAGIPHERVYRYGNVVGGQDNWLAVPAPSRGYLTKFVVKQHTGTTGGFTATLYNSLMATPQSSITADAEKEPVLSQDVYQITQLTAAGASARVDGVSIPYENQDVSAVGRAYKLYLNIHPVDTGTFDIGIGISSFPID